MDLKRLYYEVKNYIDMVDFSKLWRGFEPLKFALYTENECFFDGKTRIFDRRYPKKHFTHHSTVGCYRKRN